MKSIARKMTLKEKLILISVLGIAFFMTGCYNATKDKTVERDPTLFLLEEFYHGEIEIGFKCNADGSPTEVVHFFEDLMEQKNYKEIALHLNNINPAYRVLSTLLIEKLLKKRKISSNPVIDRAILRNKKSWDLVYFCSGCTYNSFAPMWECFQPNFLFELEIKIWFDQLRLEAFDYNEFIQQSNASVTM